MRNAVRIATPLVAVVVFATVFATVLATVAVSSASAGEPRGPQFGSNRFETEIVPAGKSPDLDDYVAALAAGEKLTVRLAASPGSTLAPTLRLVDPDGDEIDPAAAPIRGARRLALRNFVVPRTGTWTVRVGADGGTQGAYAVTFRIASPRPARLSAQRLGGGAPTAATHAFEAVDGALLSLRLRSSGPGAPVTPRSLVDPAGRDVPLPAEALDAGRGSVRVKDLVLSGGSGAYRLGVGTDGAEATYSLVLAVTPPPRPRGRTELSAAEPSLRARATPLTGSAGALVRVEGAHFPNIPPYARVFFGEAPATVAAVGAAGTHLDVVAPAGADDALVDVTVQNPDGQAVTRSAYFRFVSRIPLDVLRIDPAEAVLQQGARRTFTVTLTRPAPPLGADVELTATESLGSLPARVHVGGNETEARFEFVASDLPAAGRIVASYVASVAAYVTIAPPARLASLAPSPAVVLEGARETFVVALEAPAPPAGIDVEISTTGGIGTAPAWIHVPGEATSVPFEFAAGSVRAAGTIRAASANAVEAAVAVVPPTTIDLSGWRIEQANSSRTFTMPAGTVLHEGDYLVIGRAATRAQFGTYWGRTLGSNVVYVDGGDQWPSINGSETFHLKDADGESVDGPTTAMTSSGGSVLERRPGLAPADAASWTSASASPVSNATPGTGQDAAAIPPGVYVSEFADATGSGNYVYEFVELYFDRLP